MSKQIKNELEKFSKEELIKLILDLKMKYKPVKEYFDYFINPDEQSIFQKFKQEIINEFYPDRGYARLRFSVAKKAISSFKSLSSSASLLADLMLTLPENAIEFTHDFGDMNEAFYTSAENNFEAALTFICKNSLEVVFRERINAALIKSEVCGYGFPDILWSMANEHGFNF